MTFNRIVYFLAALALFVSSCSTKNNTFVSRAYHNVTARYNGYYYSNENLADGIYKIEKSNKDNFEKILPVFIYPTADKVKATFPEFDKAIKKSSLCIQRHAIKDKKGNEIPTAGKWIDNNWINIGIAHFHKREFFSAIEAFEYVVRTYNKSNDKYTAMLWLVKANNEIGSVSGSEQILSLLKNERRNLPRKIRNELPVIWADYYIRRGMYTEAVARLMEATRNTSFLYGLPKKRRARYSFIIAQLSEQLKDNKRAMEYYRRTIRLKPNYEMAFYSKIKQARLIDVKRSNPEKTKKDLLKMTKEFKNNEYYDVIYYTLGEIEEKQRNISQALFYFKKSVQTSVSNPNQKALSYLKLGEINFDLTNYQPAEAYYDSTIATLPGDHPDYPSILARKKTLESLVNHIKTITREDSLQRIARMSESERDAFIKKMMDRIEKEEERKQQEAEAAKNAATVTNTLQGSGMDNGFGGMPGSGTSWYFYNPTTVSFGKSDFVRKWGNRKLEDNWRRSNKAVVLEDEAETKDTAAAKGAGGVGGKKATVAKTKEYYLKNVPLNDTMMKRSDTKIIRAYYMMGTIYKEDLHNNKKAIAALEELNRRYPDNQYALNSYYSLYRIYQAERNNERAEYYKNKILTEYPDSEFASLIKNPDYALELNTKKSEVENFYAAVFEAYSNENYNESYTKSKEGIAKFGKNDYRPKFEFIKAMSAGKIKGVDTLEQNLKLLVAKYPDSEVTPRANDVLAAISKQKNPVQSQEAKKDTFQVNFESVHFIIAITPDDPKVADAFKTNLGNFNTVFYNDKKFEISSNLFGSNKQLIVVKSFPNAKDAMTYYDNLQSDEDVYKGAVKKELIDVFPISADNLPFLYKSKNVEAYRAFFGDTYKRLNRN